MSKQHRIRIRKGGFWQDKYLDRNGQWVTWKDAAIFTTHAAADSFAEQHGITDYGVF